MGNLDKKDGAYLLMWQQFKRAMGVVIVWGNAMYKMGCLHYVRGTAAEAAAATTAHHSNNKLRAGQNRQPRWFTDHILEGCGTFEHFHNDQGFRVY